MKKPTFSKLLFSVFFLFENFFQKNFIKTSFCKDFRNLKSPVFEKKSFFRLEYTITVFIFALFLLSSNGIFAQEGRKFLPRLSGGNIKVQGDVILIGNTVLNKVNDVGGVNPVIYSPAPPVDGVKYLGTVTNQATLTAQANLDNFAGGNNNNFFVEYIDLDSDLSTYNSTSANLFINQKCKKIVFAGLYWSAIYPYDRSTKENKKYEGSLRDSDFNTIKFKTPADATYRDLVADEIIFNGYKYNGPNVSDSFKDSPYVCFKDVTSILDKLTEADGEYTVANVRASRGKRDGGGAGGWTLVVVYDTPNLPSKFVSVFDGYEGVNPDVGTPGYLPEIIFDVDGFRTLPTGFAVKAYIGVGALEGDQSAGGGDTFQILGKKNIPSPAPNPLTGFTEITDVLNPSKNFFNSTITRDGVAVTNRKPKSSNTLGFDVDYVKVPNTNNATIGNNEQGAKLKLTTTGDGYGAFVTTFAVDIIEPIVKLIKEVKNDKNVPIGNTNVKFGDVLFYEINFKNSGSDDVGDKDKNGNPVPFIIKDILPENINFDPTTIDLTNAGGATLKSYDPATRTLLFTMPIAQLKQNSPEYQIRFKVQVVADCNELKNACINSIDNRAYVSYIGVYNNDKVFTDESLNSYGCVFVPQATNFLVGIDSCKFSQTMIYCGNDITLVARPGYENYVWSSSPTGVPVLKSGPDAFYTANKAGTYYAFDNTTIFPCKSIVEQITVLDVKDFVNPVIDYAKLPGRGTVDECKSNGEKLPKIFLCGKSDEQLIQTNLSYNSTAKWEKLDEASCPIPVFPINEECANKNPSCKWNVVGTANDFLAKDAGYYKVTFSFTGGCSVVYYFNVYKNNLDPTAVTTDQFCTAKGSIKVKPVPLVGYEFSLDNAAYQDSPDFLNVALGTHNVKVRLKAAGVGSCEIPVKGPITISPFTMDVEVQNVKHPLCTGDLGSFRIQAKDVRPGYYFSATLNGTLVESVGPIGTVNGQNFYDFTGKAPGDYVVRTWTLDGCDDTRTVKINAPIGLKATAAVKPLTCNNGEINVTVQGGVSPYYYSVNNGPFLTSNLIPVVAPGGKYDIVVADSNGLGCKYTIPQITVNPNPKPVYTVVPTNILCYGTNTGAINFNVTSNTSGYTLAYSIDGGTTYSNNPLFSSLVANTVYSPKFKYSLNGVDCIDTLPTITLTGPTATLTASAGVSELAGCGPNGEGKIRITNPQGGTPFPVPFLYQYSFDNQATWQNSNEAYLPIGNNYTVYIKDAKGCIFPMTGITIDKLPPNPDIKDPKIVYSCDGTATGTVTVINPPSINYDFTYSIDGVANTPPTNNVFVGIKAGSHTIKVGYVLKTVTTYSNLLSEDFGRGGNVRTIGIDEESAPKIEDGYCYHDLNFPSLCKNTSTTLEDNQYVVTKAIIPNNSAWYPFRDHTSGGTDAIGRFLAINIGKAAGSYGVLYSKKITDVIPNQPVIVDLYVANLLLLGRSGAAPIFRFQLVDASGAIVGLPLDTGKIAEAINDPNRNKWIPISISLNPGANKNLTFEIRSGSTDYNGNDTAIDDIKVYQLPTACGNYFSKDILIDDNKGFTAQVRTSTNVQCPGSADGTIEITAQNFDPIAGFEYSKDGVTWSKSTTSPVKLTNLGAGTYTPQVRYNTLGACIQSLTPTKINAPSPIVVKTTQTLATCLPNGGATVDATGTTGGTGAYTIQLVNTVSPFAVTNFPNTLILNNVAPGTYTVVVRDVNSCKPTTDPTITIAPTATPTAIIDPSSSLCFDPTTGANIVVKVTGGVGPYTYKSILNGGTPSASSSTFTGPLFTFNATVTGTYSFEVTDSFGCKANTVNQIINAKLAAAAAVTTALDCDIAPASPNAVITVTITDGSAPYKYKVKKGLGLYGGSTFVIGSSFTNQIAAANADTYTFEITDNLGCVTTASTTVNTLVPVTAGTPITTNPTCFDGTDGQIQLIGAGGSGGGYQYNFNGAGFSTTSLYTALNANTTTANTTDYSYQVKDSNGCVSGTYTITLNNPTAVVASASIPANTTCRATTVITSAGAGGAGGYSYSFNGSATYTGVNTLTVNLTAVAQTITYSVKDSKGCIDTDTIIIPAYNPPIGISFSGLTTITCNNTTTDVTLAPTVAAGAAVAPFTYLITAGPATATTNVSGASTGIFAGLLPGNYTFQVTDANGCKASASLPIDAAAVIAVAGSKTDIQCFGASDGTAKFTVTGASGVGNYTYTLSPSVVATSNAANVITFTGLAAGTYDLQVTDSTTGCTSITASVTIKRTTAIAFTVAATKINCNNKISTISFPTLSGGTPVYTYAFVTSGPTTPAATDYSASTTVDTALLGLNIDVYVKDNNGCIATKQTIVIGKEMAPVINTPATICYTGTPIAITITGTTTGTTTYSVDNVTYGLSPNFNLGVGTHTLYIKDGFGCTAQTTYVVKPQLTLTAIAAADLTCTANTTINLTAAGGTGTLVYEVSSDGGTTYGPSTNQYVTATAGTYTFKVTDAASPACSVVSADVVVKTKATVLTIGTSKTDVKCFGDTTGIITITPTSGIAPYTYSVTRALPTASVAVIQVSNGAFTGLIAGTYDIVVTDALGCTSSPLTSVTIGELSQLTATTTLSTALSCGAGNAPQVATITVTAPSGGNGTYEYSYNSGAYTSSTTYTTSTPGNVTISMRDSNNCSIALASVLVNTLNPPVISGLGASIITCKPLEATSTATITITGGTGTPVYTIVSGPISNATGLNSGVFTGLTAGNYVFKVTDDNGCSDTENYNIPARVDINANLQSQVNVLCFGNPSGSAKINVTNFSTYTAVLTSGVGTVDDTVNPIDVIGLIAGSYTLRITDDNTDCFKDVSFTITEATDLGLLSSTNVNANCNKATATVTVEANGGKSPYKYAFVVNGASPLLGDYTSSNIGDLNPATTDWDVYVLDANNCSKKILDVTVTADALPSITAPAAQCFTGTPFTITLLGSGGIGALTYTVNGATIVGNTYSITAAGTYTLGVKDANNCPVVTVPYVVDKQLKAGAALEKDLTCSAPQDATINVTITDGFAPFTYQIYDGATAIGVPKVSLTATFQETFATLGNYSFAITDSKSCSVTTNDVLVTDTVPLVLNPIVLDKPILCNGESTAEIKITYDNTQGTAPFVINVKQYTTIARTVVLKDFATQTSGLPAGFYTVTLTDAKGCFKTEDIDIAAPTPIVITAKADPITCGAAGLSKGSVTISTVTGGTGPYDYFITGKFYTNSALAQTGGSVVFNVVDPGLYHVIVKDANGCTAVVMPDLLVASDVKDLDVDVTLLPPPNCTGGGSAVVAIGALSTNITGSGPFFFQIYTGAPQIYPAGIWLPEDAVGSKKTTFTGLTPGVSYTFVVYDADAAHGGTGTGCYFTSPSTFTIATNSKLKSSVAGFNNVTCKGAANGTVSFDINSITSSYIASTDITYEIFDAITLTTTGINGTGTVPINGTLSITNIGPLPVGTYYVLIKEAAGATNAGCSITTPNFSIAESLKLLSVSASVSKKSNSCVANSGVITAIAKDGTGPYLYQIFTDTGTVGVIDATDNVTTNPVFSASFIAIHNLNSFNKSQGDYIIYAKDAYGCIKEAYVSLVDDLAPTIVTPVAVCYTGTSIALTITGNTAAIVGPVTYSVDNGAVLGAYKSNPNFNLVPGSYTLNLKDGNGCVASTPFEIKDQLTLTHTLTKELDCTTAGANATVTVTAGGGNIATYIYTITAGTTFNGTGAATGIFTDLDAGTYTFQVNDGSCSKTTTIIIDALVPIAPVATKTNPLCVGANGKVVVTATGGTGVYEYKKGLAGVYSTNNIFIQTALEGAVTYYVRDSKNCEQTIIATLTDPAPIVISTIDVVQLKCAAGNSTKEATITVNATGGTGTLEYSFDNGVNYSLDNEHKTSISGTYNVIVKDANGCTTIMQPEIIAPLVLPTLAPTKTIIDCTNTTSTVTLHRINGLASFTYSVEYNSNGSVIPSQTNDDVFLLVPAGDYSFRVTDSNGCIDEELVKIAPVIPIQLQEEVIANVNCFGDATGSAKFTVTGFSATQNYAITTIPAALPFTQVGDVITISNLLQGAYSVTVQDNITHCSMTKSVTISQPGALLDITASASNVNCNDSNSAITVNPAGGTPIYEYAFVEGGALAPTVFSNNTTLDTATLTNGVVVGLGMTWSVDVYVKDANNCTDFVNITITKDDVPTITVPAQLCYTGANLIVDLNTYTTVHGGMKTYTLAGFDLASSIATFTAPGTYKLGIRDDNGCEAFVNYIIQNQLSAAVTLTKDLYCTGAVAATIDVVIKDGVGPYSTQLYSGIAPAGVAVGLPVVGPNFIASVATAGDYYFVTTDSNTPACNVTTTKVTVTVPAAPVIVATPITQSILCTGGKATMQVNIDNNIGLAPYTYVVTSKVPLPIVTTTQVSNPVFTGLLAGDYDITVRDAKGCFVTTPITVSEPAALAASVDPFLPNTTCGLETVITVNGLFGTPTGTGTGYYYNFNGEGYTDSNTYTVNNVNGVIQKVTFTVKDANGCEVAGPDVFVNPLNKPTKLSFNATAITCKAGENVSTVAVTATDGVGALTFKIISTNTTTAPALWGPIATAGSPFPASFPGLLPGDYTFQVTDSNGCSYELLYTVKDVVNIAAAGQLVAGVACNSEANGAVTFTVSGFGAGGFTHAITGVNAPGVITPVGTDTFELTNLVTGNYQIDVQDNTTGCLSTFTVFVPEPLALGVNYGTLKNANCKLGTEIQATATNGTTGYTYAFVKTAGPKIYFNSDTAILDPALSWEVWAKDAHGCEVSVPIIIITDPIPSITSVVATQCPSAIGTYDITVTASGVSALEYSLDGNSFQSGNVLTVTSPGNYTVTVRDVNQCTATAVTPVTILKPLGLQGVVSNPRSCSLINDGEITLTAFDGSGLPNYEYSIGAGAYGPSNVFSNLAAGTYTMNVRDIGTALPYCVQSVQVVIDVPTLVTGMALTTTAVSCQGSSDGSITVALAPSTLTVNNNPDYNYSLTGTTLNPLPLGVAVNRPNQLSNVFDNLEAGTYTITTTSSRGCQYSKTITVNEPAAIVVPAPVVVDYACSVATPSNTMNLATITVNLPTGGSGKYPIYEFVKGVTVVQSDLSNVYTQTDLSGGTFTINVYDSKGCVGTTTATINPFLSIDFAATAITVTKAKTCVNDEDIQVNVTTTGTTVPMPLLKYDIIGLSTGSTYGDTNFTGAFTGLTVGDYMVTVTNPDTGCAIQKIHYVNEPNTFDLNVVNKSDVVCYGSNEGSVEFNFIDRSPLPADESGPYSYIIKDASGAIVRNGNSTNAAPELITGLKSGTYTITATLTSPTGPQCTTEVRSFTINQPTQDLVISKTHTAITCANNDGSISVSAVGGWPGDYVFQLEETTLGVISPWSATTDFNGLIAGNYVVKVRDTQTSLNSTFCERQVAISLGNPTPITATIIVDKPILTCFGETNATITINTVNGGSGVYNYALEATYPNGTVTLDGSQSSNVFTNLGAASYKVIVTDTWTCSSVSNTLVISEPNVVSASLVQTSVQTCRSPATLTLSAVGGTGPYTYSADPNFATVLGSFASSTLITVPFTAVGINPLFYVRDVNGCSSTASNSVSVTPLEPLDFKFENDAPFINCFGDSNGQITAIAKGGSGNYIYTLLNSAGNPIVPTPTQPTAGFFTDLAAGTYLMEVKSGDCTSARKPITITEPSSKLRYTPKVTDVLCNGYANGKLEISATGGSPAIVYALSPELSKFVTTSNFENLEVGDYKAIIQDLKGCNYVYDFKIKEPLPIDAKVDPLSIKQELCAGEKTGEFGIVITPGSGTAPYGTSLDDPKGTFVLGQVLFTGLSGGNHTVYIKDANSCTYELAVALDPSVILNPVATVSNECVNYLPANKVTVTIDPSNIPADVTYSLDAAGVEQNSNVFNNLTPGDHYIMVHHKNGCDDATPVFPIDKIDPLAITIDLGGLNEIVATVTGGSSVYQFTVNGVSIGSNNKYIYFKSGNYTVTVTDSNGCVASATKYFEFIDIIIPPIFTPTGDGTNDSWKPSNTENYPDIKFVVYDRYGRVVGTFGAGQSWDGKYNGTELPMGDYWYVLKLRHNQDDREFMGHFTLYR